LLGYKTMLQSDIAAVNHRLKNLWPILLYGLFPKILAFAHDPFSFSVTSNDIGIPDKNWMFKNNKMTGILTQKDIFNTIYKNPNFFSEFYGDNFSSNFKEVFETKSIISIIFR
jgi:hypothetical protein